jgi:hypothetical protein
VYRIDGTWIEECPDCGKFRRLDDLCGNWKVMADAKGKKQNERL